MQGELGFRSSRYYTLVDIPYVDPRTFRLEPGGAVAHPVALTLDEQKARPTVTLECADHGIERGEAAAAARRTAAPRGARLP